MLYKPFENCATCRGGKVERQAALPPVKALEIETGVAGLVWGNVASNVATRIWILDLDDLCSHIAEKEGGKRAGADLLE